MPGVTAAAPSLEVDRATQLLLTLERVERAALEHPKAPAITGSDQTVTYGELVYTARRVAARFAEDLDIQQNRVICIYSNDCLSMIVGALAAWQLGCAYLPADPTSPRERLEHMLREADVNLIWVSTADASRVPRGSWKVAVFDCKSLLTGSRDTGAELASRRAAEDADIAYVIFTSGSTGQPKGARVMYFRLCKSAGGVSWFRLASKTKPGKEAYTHGKDNTDSQRRTV